MSNLAKLGAAAVLGFLSPRAPAAPPPAAPAGSAGGRDAYVVKLAVEGEQAPRSGRVILFFVTEGAGRRRMTRPIDGPFFHNPQPIASMAVSDLRPGQSVVLQEPLPSFPEDLDALEGTVRVQALLDCDQTERSRLEGPGNLYSQPVEVELHAGRADHVELTLSEPGEAPAQRPESEHLKWVRLRSPRLSQFYGRDVYHRAGVALPKGYVDPAQAERRWPAIYVIPGFGGRDEEAVEYAHLHAMPGSQEIAPQSVHIVLDPESPLGHHGFVDSPNHGPRGTALVEELIPYLEQRFRLVPGPEGRIVTGHSSGGWTSLWLALQWPAVFGACWSAAPDPVDFRAFQMTNIYEDASLYEDAQGRPTPSYRTLSGPEEELVLMTVRQEAMMEYAIDPLGGSGEQWDAWEAMFSPRDGQSGMPRPLFDPLSGRIDRDVAETWRTCDIGSLVRAQWERYGPILNRRVRLACGTLDSFYLNRAVELLKATVEERGGNPSGPGYILLVDGATHGNLPSHIAVRWNREMREYLQENGFSQAPAGQAPRAGAPPAAPPQE